MIKKGILFVILTFLVSCKSTDKIWLYKDTNLVLKPISNTIYNFTWNNNTLGERDSVNIKNRKKLLNVIKSIKKQKGMDKSMNFAPDYAFVLKYNNINDTLYFSYDLEYGYFVENDSLIIDKDRKIKKFLLKNKKYTIFMKKDFFYYEQEFYKKKD
jgi:hypothetical protein